MSVSSQNPEFRSLMEAARNGSQDAARELVARYGASIIRSVRRKLNRQMRSKFDSLDFVQNVWASFFADLPQRELFASPQGLATYLVTMAEHKVVDEYRRRMVLQKRNVKRERSLDDSELLYKEGLPSASPTPSQVMMAEELWEQMRRTRPEHYQKMIELRQAGNTCQEIADELGVNERTVRRVLDGLRDELSP